MTQDQLAERSGVPQTTISRHLRDEGLPRVSHLDAYESVLPKLRKIRDRDRRKSTAPTLEVPVGAS